MSGSTTKLSRRAVLAGGGAAAMAASTTANASKPGSAKPSPPTQGTWPTHYRFKFGDFEITVLSDGATYPKGPYPIWAADEFEEDVNEVVKANFLPTERFELSYAPIVINTGKELLLFDTGNGKARGPGRGFALDALKAAGYSPAQIDAVVITHCHPDHIGALLNKGQAIYPNARYIVGAMEYNFWSPKSQAEGNDRIASRAKVVQTQLVPLAAKATFIKNDGEVVPGINAVFSPGHTPGHLAYHVESAGQRMMIWGDAIVHFVMSIQRPEWELAADMDHETAIATRKKLLDMAATDRLLVTGYHLPFPAVGFIDKTADGYRYVPASYQLNL